MRAVDVLIKKRDGIKLSDEEIAFFVRGVVGRAIPDYQASAWLMAAYLNGLDFDELAALTRAMMDSGRRYDLSSIPGVKVDKHSTGGVGDKVSLILAPLAAAAGARVPMVSGRSLGHTGGTLDKLESIPGPAGASRGYNPYLAEGDFVRQVGALGCAIIGQSDDFVPADKILYALRDVTGTVESIPLIAASILSKKFAAGVDAVVMDVKTGSGAFMSSLARARELSQTLQRLADHLGRRVVCVLTDMSQPLGRWIGNAVEVRESIEVLKGTGDVPLTRLCLELGAWMLRLAGVEADHGRAVQRLGDLLINGAALRKFADLVAAQGGDPEIIRDPSRLRVADKTAHFRSPATGFIESYDTRAIGVASMLLGAGRQAVSDGIDPAVGILVRHKVCDAVTAGEPLFSLYYNDEARREAALSALESSVRIAARPPAPAAMIHEVIGA